MEHLRELASQANLSPSELYPFLSDTCLALLRTYRSGAHGLYWSRVWAIYSLARWCEAHKVSLSET